MIRSLGRLLGAIAGLAVAPVLLAQTPATPGAPMTLLDAVRLGRDHATSAVGARNSARAALARVGERRSELLPTIAGSASWTRQTLNLDEFGLSIPGFPPVTPDFSVWRAQITGRMSVFDASVLARVHAARDNAAAAGLDAQAAAEYAGAVAGYQYLRVLGADETVRARTQDSVIAASLMQQARRLVDAGVGASIDGTRSEVNFAAVRTQLEIARNARDRARLDLIRALDLPAGAPVLLADSLATPSVPLPADVDSAVTFAWAHRTDLAAEHARTEAQQRTLTSIRAENLPSIGVGGSYTQSGRASSNMLGTYNLQIGVSVPILDGFKRQTRAGEQQALLDVQRTREHDLQRQIETEVRQAALDIASARQQMAIAADRVRLAETELAQAQQRFDSGVAGSVETTQAQGALIQAHDAFIQARLAYAVARLGAYRALGVLDQLQ